MIRDWWLYYVASFADTLKALLIGVGATAVLLLLVRWLMRPGGPLNK